MPQYLNAADFRKDYPEDPLGAAIRASNYGGVIYCPGDEVIGPWRPPTKDGWTIDKPLQIYGDGRVNEACGLGYYIDPIRGTADSTIINLKQGANHFYLHDIALSGATGIQSGVRDDPRGFTVPYGTGCGVKFVDPGKVIWGTCFERVGVLYSGGHALDFTPQDAEQTAYFVSPVFHNVSLYGSNGYGIRMRNTTAISFHAVSMNQNRLGALWGHSLDGVLSDCWPEGNGYDQTDPANEAAGLYIEDSAALTIRCRFEDCGHGKAQTHLFLRRCEGVVVDGCAFELPGKRGIYAENVKNCTFGQNSHYGLETTLEIANDGVSKDCHIYDQKNMGWSAGTGQSIVPANQKHFRYKATTENEISRCVIPPSAPAPNSSGQVFYDKPNRRVRLWDGSRWRTIGSY